AEALKAKFSHAVDRLTQIIQKKIEGRGMEAVKMIMESVERCQAKRLTLTPHYDIRVEDFVVNEVLSVFKKAEEDEVKAKEEAKKRQEEEEKKSQEEKQKMLLENTTTDCLMIKTSERVIEDKGKALASEHDPLVLILQEQLATQKAEQELLKEDVKNLT
ncbi:hypothetical protein A2U01_0042876, partial [Trifolium medium]|nr:hypothetical protein [Trifolium medium]